LYSFICFDVILNLDLNAYKWREASKQFYDNVAGASSFESKREEFFNYKALVVSLAIGTIAFLIMYKQTNKHATN